MIETKLITSTEDLSIAWDALVAHDIFLQSAYLKALEQAAPANISMYFIEFYKENTLVGVAIIQRVKLYLNDMFRNQDDSYIQTYFKNHISKVLKGNILVIGNLTHTGQHGLFYNENVISNMAFFNALLPAVFNLKAEIKKQHGKKIRAILFKDYFLSDIIHKHQDSLFKQGFHQLKVQPNMVLNIPSNWDNFDDYLSKLHKKYRDRYKRAKKKAMQVTKIALDETAILQEADNMYRLYQNVSNQAKINTFLLPKNHFYQLKVHLGDAFQVFGYYFENKLIGFYTLITNNEALETYFLGYDKTYLNQHQLYLNMLYDMLEFGINKNFKAVIYARTAMEIKSSVGATPETMQMYLKHTNWFMNMLLKAIFKLMNPSKNWIERHPFKQINK
ncbi:GNAT family N-acetyltransferase [Bizionia sp. KMM 8389]